MPVPNNSGFRPDIQGLRAVAILLVVLGHYGMPGFSGGFIGVDIFFVISGYLVTGILFKTCSSTAQQLNSSTAQQIISLYYKHFMQTV